MRYSISYDLNAPGKDYQRLWDALVQLGARRVLLSQWVTSQRTGTDAAKLRDWIWTFMDSNDRLMVICLDNGNWAGQNLMVDPQTV